MISFENTCSFLFLLCPVSSGVGQRRSDAGVPPTGMSARARAALAASCFAINKNLIMLSLKKKENTFHSCKDFAVMSLQMIPQIRWVSPREDSES